jgi:hypothetical protein
MPSSPPAPRLRRRAKVQAVGAVAAIAAVILATPFAVIWAVGGTSPTQALQAAGPVKPATRPAAAPRLPPLRGPATVKADTAALPLIDTLVTRSGHWRLYDAGRDDTLARYVWTLDEKPAFVRVMVCKRAFTHEAGDGAALELTPVAAEVRHRGQTQYWQLQVAQGSCRIAQNGEPVAPRADWLRGAVADGRLPAYRREQSFRPAARKGLKPGPAGGAYDATSLGGDSSNRNYVGVTSAQGGEYVSSRGFIHDIDAQLIDAVLHGEEIARSWDAAAAYSWYSLAQPQGAVWSAVNHVTVDPQFPQPGDRPWEIANAGARARPDIDSVVPTDRWKRDLAHLENTGFAHWILTEDPVAGLLVQRQAAYALASYYEYRRTRGDRRYRAYDEQERGMYNLLSATWKARDVSARVASSSGRVIWRSARVAKMADDVIADLDARRFQPMMAAAAGPGDDYVRRIVGLPLAKLNSSAWKTATGGEVQLRGSSAFELPQYGKEPLYLWTRAGDARVARWFARSARHLTVRALHIGGARGIDRSENARGSAFPAAPVGAIPFADDLGWAAWVKRLPIADAATDNFDGAGLHTLTQVKGTLQLARAAGLKVPELDAALARIDADWARTSTPRYAGLESAKHWASPN